MGQQFNIENLAFQQEQADVTVVAVEAMKAGRDKLKESQNVVNMDSVDKLMEDLAEQQDEMKQVNEALAGISIGGIEGIEDDELAAEYAKMEEEAAAMKLMGGGGALSSSAGPVLAPAATAPAPVAAAPMPTPAAAQALAA